MKSRLCTICARGGSKGVKGKNIRKLEGLPMIAYSIKQAKETELFEYIAVSSDSDEILSTSLEFGADIIIKRPPELSGDKSAKIPAIIHCVKSVEEKTKKYFDTIVDLDATSPLRTAEDVSNVVKMLEEENCENVITAMPSRRSPYFNMIEISNEGKVDLVKRLETPLVRRQDAPKCFDMNASIYAWKKEALLNNEKSVFLETTRLYVMPEERSIDVDSEIDFELVEFFMKKRSH